MKLVLRHKVCLFSIVAGTLLSLAGLLLAQELSPANRKGVQPLVPVFSTALDSPKFVLDYSNDTNEAVDIPGLLRGSSVVLDGKVYPRTGVKFVGNPSLGPGRTKSFTITLAAYLPKWEKKGYSKTLKRWRWKSPLKSGRHTLLVKLGDKEYGPITFVWEGDGPLLYE